MPEMFICYNMFPSMFSSIEEMTDYLETIKDLGFNAVWLNPIQDSGPKKDTMLKADRITGYHRNVNRSIYAMHDHTLLNEDLFNKKLKVKNLGSVMELLNILKSQNDTDLANLDDELLLSLYNEVHSSLWKGTYTWENIKRSAEKEEPKSFLIRKLYTNIQKIKSTDLDRFYKAKTQRLIFLHTVLLQFEATLRIKIFTKTAQDYGITPLFDLVLNHVAKDSPLLTQYPSWFIKNDKSQNVKKFLDTENFNYSTTEVTEEIINFWKRYIDKYVDCYGFKGVRIDCVAGLTKRVREELYSYLHTRLGDESIIFEEALFNNESLEHLLQEAGDIGGTYITGSNYYVKRKAYGQLGEHHHKEMEWKRKIVSGGVVHFSGSHDHYTCAMSAIRNFVMNEKLTTDTQIKNLYYDDMVFDLQAELKKNKQELGLQNHLLSPYIIDVVSQLKSQDSEDIRRLITSEILERFAIVMFSSAAGYYMLSGDEAGNIYTPMVYKREENEIYPQRQLHLLGDEEDIPSLFTEKYDTMEKPANFPNCTIVYENIKKYAETALDQIVIHYLLPPQNPLFDKVTPKAVEAIINDYNNNGNYDLSRIPLEKMSDGDRILFDHLKKGCRFYILNEIHGGQPNILQNFREKLASLLISNQLAHGYLQLCELATDLWKDVPRNYLNNWHAPFYSPELPLDSYISSMNRVLAKLPVPTSGEEFWCDTFNKKNIKKDEVVIFVRLILGSEKPYSIVVVNLFPHAAFCFDVNTFEDLSKWIPQRTKDLTFRKFPKLVFDNSEVYAIQGVTIKHEDKIIIGYEDVGSVPLQQREGIELPISNSVNYKDIESVRKDRSAGSHIASAGNPSPHPEGVRSEQGILDQLALLDLSRSSAG